ncbi:hypothetical protein KUCAC02_004019, partial [Chaenocephalus aceratus]
VFSLPVLKRIPGERQMPHRLLLGDNERLNTDQLLLEATAKHLSTSITLHSPSTASDASEMQTNNISQHTQLL